MWLAVTSLTVALPYAYIMQGQEEVASGLRSSLDVMEDSRDAALDDAAGQRLLAAQYAQV